jgi:hypothetical protein
MGLQWRSRWVHQEVQLDRYGQWQGNVDGSSTTSVCGQCNKGWSLDELLGE